MIGNMGNMGNMGGSGNMGGMGGPWSMAIMDGKGNMGPGIMNNMSNSGPGPDGGVESRDILIAANLISGVIGPGGSTINDLRKQAGPTALIAIVPGSIPTSQGG